MTLFKQLQGKKVLLTGHTGFKGSWLALWLSKLGATVCGYALKPETTPNLFELANVDTVLDHNIGDVRDFDSLLAVFTAFKPEVVFHLAAQPLVRRSYATPRETFDTNVMGTVNVLEAIRQTDSVVAAVMITTDKVYENKEWRWGYRENEPMGGHDPYSASKGASEIVISSYRRSFFSDCTKRQVGIASVRAGNVIGGGDFSEDRIIPDAVRAYLAAMPLEVRSPKSVRPWQHVLEPLGAYLLIANKLMCDDGSRYAGAWNVGPYSHDVATVEQIVGQFFSSLGAGEYRDVSQKQDNAVHEANLLMLCCDKIQAELGWRPQYLTKETTELTARWYKDVLIEKEEARKVTLAQIAQYTKKLEMCDL